SASRAEEKTSSEAADRESARTEWYRLAAIVTGTRWEARGEEEARKVLERLPHRSERKLLNALRLAPRHLDRKQWIPALEALLSVEGELDDSKEGREAREMVLTGLFEEEHMLFIPRGSVVSPSGTAIEGALLGPFLVDAHSTNSGGQGVGISFAQ